MTKRTIMVDTFTDGVIGPDVEMLGPVTDGGYIIANTAPGCWGPMITPAIKGGHEVTQPVAVEGAELGDSIAIRIVSIDVTSKHTSSGNEEMVGGQNLSDAIVAGKCPNCGALYPESHIEGIGQEAVKCAECGESASPFSFTSGYTVAFDDKKTMAITLDEKGAKKVAEDPCGAISLPDQSIQNPILAFAPHDLPGLAMRTRPFMGQLGTVPSKRFPDSHNAGDFGSFLIGSDHEFAIEEEELVHTTDGHMDINRVRAGAILIVLVKVPGGGVYAGDMHAMQGDGEIAAHTTDVAGIVVLQVKVIKGLELEGPILLPLEEDLPFLAKPLSNVERIRAEKLSEEWGVDLEKNAPISFIGSGANLNDAVSSALGRASKLLDMPIAQIMNRTTILGGLEIGRAPGVVTASFRAPVDKLKELGIYDLIAEHYSL